MKDIRQHISESILDTDKVDDKKLTVDFKDVCSEIEDALKGVSIDFKKTDVTACVEYRITFGKKEQKSNTDLGAVLGLTIVVQKETDEYPASISATLGYNNGKRSYSVYSNPNKSYIYKFDYSDITDVRVITPVFANKYDTYVCTTKVMEKMVKGIKYLRYDKHQFEDAIAKSRFTSQQFDKLIGILKSDFGTK